MNRTLIRTNRSIRKTMLVTIITKMSEFVEEVDSQYNKATHIPVVPTRKVHTGILIFVLLVVVVTN